MARQPVMHVDHLDADNFSPLGSQGLVPIDLGFNSDTLAASLSQSTQCILVGIDRAGACPNVQKSAFDVLLTVAPSAPAPWVSVPPARLDDRVQAISATCAGAPFAAAAFAQVLRIGEGLTLSQATVLESFAYSALLGGNEFRDWLARRRAPAIAKDSTEPFVTICRKNDIVRVTLNRPKDRNALCAGMRDALFEALAAVLDDPSEPRLRLEGAGGCFSTGGPLAEFGTAKDLAAAHFIRTLHNGAILLSALGERAEVMLHGACIGSGIELPAAAARRLASAHSYFQLPEIKMGLIPGAGGTATLSRAIGRHRTAYMGLSGRRIDSATALSWGLIHAIVPDG